MTQRGSVAISAMHWRKIFASCNAFGLLHAILRAKARNSDFPRPAISRHLALRRDSAIRRRSHWLLRQFERLLRGAERDNDHACGAQEVSLPSREARVFWQVLRTIHLAAPQRDNCSTHQRPVVGRASHTRRPIAVARARPLSPPTAHQKFFLATICPIPALESTSGMVPPSSNHPRKRSVSRRHVCARDAYRLRHAGNAAMP